MEHFEALYPETARFDEIEKLLSFVKEGNSTQLVSLPGVGRSNLLGLLSYNTKVRIKHLGSNQKWFHFVYLNFSEVKNKSFFEVTKYIFIGLLDSLRDRKKEEEYEAVSKIFKESLEFNDELVLFTGLKKTIDYLAIEKEYTVILLFDRFETYISSVTSDFFTNLKILRNRAKYRFSCVFSLQKPLEEILEKEILADFYELVVGHIVFLKILDNTGLDFRISYLEKAKNQKIDKRILNQVLDLTGGHGKLTRLCAEAILSSVFDNKKNAEYFLLTQKPVLGALFEIWSSFSPFEQSLLEEKKYDYSFFEQLELVRNGKITIKLLEEYIKKTNSEKQKEKITFDQNNNQIKIGEAVLSDNLTSSEFRLLKFLIENPSRIIDREEIINSVWKDTQTVAGVTDQALDQLISRLRKKIEDNPNKPVHLETIKGRGLRFIP